MTDPFIYFFHVLDMLGILKVVELKESNMTEIRCLNYQLCHLSPDVVTYLTPKNLNHKKTSITFVFFLPYPSTCGGFPRLFLYKPHTIVVDNGNIRRWIPFNETFQVILVRGDVCKLKIS